MLTTTPAAARAEAAAKTGAPSTGLPAQEVGRAQAERSQLCASRVHGPAVRGQEEVMRPGREHRGAGNQARLRRDMTPRFGVPQGSQPILGELNGGFPLESGVPRLLIEVDPGEGLSGHKESPRPHGTQRRPDIGGTVTGGRR